MGVFTLIFIVACIGLVAWAVIRWIPMSAHFATVVEVVAIVTAVAFVLHAFGLWPQDVAVPKLG